jgi:hypothetical protein
MTTYFAQCYCTPPYQLYVWDANCTNITICDQPKLVDLKESVISNKCGQYLLDNATAFSNTGVQLLCALRTECNEEQMAMRQ